VGDNKNIRLGEDPWVSYGERYKLRDNLIITLREKGLYTLYLVVDGDFTTIWRQ
jgi:hypothetical protein